jgi:signal transduction histidine kinase
VLPVRPVVQTLVIDFSPDTPRYVVGDQGRMRQIFINLISNAIKFTDKGDIRVTVTGTAASDRFAEYLIKVMDGGIGIPKEKQEYIFYKFAQADNLIARKYGGTGLGLAISKQLVEMMDGTIGVESEPGLGATFWFNLRLPLVAETDEKAVQGTPDQIRHSR